MKVVVLELRVLNARKQREESSIGAPEFDGLVVLESGRRNDVFVRMASS